MTTCDKIKDCSCVKELEAQLERERMRLACCGVAALFDTEEFLERTKTNIHDDYQSCSLNDVIRRVEECISLRKKVARMKQDMFNLAFAWAKKNRELKDLLKGMTQHGCECDGTEFVRALVSSETYYKACNLAHDNNESREDEDCTNTQCEWYNTSFQQNCCGEVNGETKAATCKNMAQ